MLAGVKSRMKHIFDTCRVHPLLLSGASQRRSAWGWPSQIGGLLEGVRETYQPWLAPGPPGQRHPERRAVGGQITAGNDDAGVASLGSDGGSKIRAEEQRIEVLTRYPVHYPVDFVARQPEVRRPVCQILRPRRIEVSRLRRARERLPVSETSLVWIGVVEGDH